MPVINGNHRKRARFEQNMADRSGTDMARIIHQRLAVMHSAAADARVVGGPVEGRDL